MSVPEKRGVDVMVAPLHPPGRSPMKGGARASGRCRRPATPLIASRPPGGLLDGRRWRAQYLLRRLDVRRVSHRRAPARESPAGPGASVFYCRYLAKIITAAKRATPAIDQIRKTRSSVMTALGRGGGGLPEGRPGHFRASGHRLTFACVERAPWRWLPYPSQIVYSAHWPPSPSQNACSG